MEENYFIKYHLSREGLEHEQLFMITNGEYNFAYLSENKSQNYLKSIRIHRA